MTDWRSAAAVLEHDYADHWGEARAVRRALEPEPTVESPDLALDHPQVGDDGRR
jgi:hypothetical protein